MVEVLKLADGKARVTKNNTTLHGIEYALTDDLRDTITFYVDNNSLCATYAEITDKHGTANAKELADYYLVNNFFFRGRVYP